VIGRIFFACMLFPLAALGEAPRELKWDDLVIRLSAADNPYAALPPQQLEWLIDVAAARDRRARGNAVPPELEASEKSALAKLVEAKVDVDGLLARRKEVSEKQRAVARAVNPELDGKLVRLPGYLLPLEFSGKQVTEFLLVPWVGACVHTPPPPPNQVVHVKADKPFELKGMFDAVWVTGRMAASSAKKSVHIVDGAADVDVGYAIKASQVEAYKQN
jgi:uncharacterized protein